MAKHGKDRLPRPAAAIVARQPWQPENSGPELASALHEDAAEVLGALRMRVQRVPSAQSLAAEFYAEKRPLVIAFADVPALPVLCVQGALQELESHAAAVGPCPDGSIYLLALSPDLPEDVLPALLATVDGPAHAALAEVIDILDEAELPATMLPPWFRVAERRDLSFAESLARLSLLSEEGEEDFLADRLRLWFERHADA